MEIWKKKKKTANDSEEFGLNKSHNKTIPICLQALAVEALLLAATRTKKAVVDVCIELETVLLKENGEEPGGQR